MFLRAVFAIVSVCLVFTLWAIAVSADDAKQAKSGHPSAGAIELGADR